MPKKTTQNTKTQATSMGSFFSSRQNQFVFSLLIMLLAILMLTAFVSFFKTWQVDQSIVSEIVDKNIKAENWIGKIGAQISHFFIFRGFGLGAFIIPLLLFLFGLYIFLKVRLLRLIKPMFLGLLSMIWISLLFGFLNLENPIYAGVVGFELNQYLMSYIGNPGVMAILFTVLITFLIIQFGWSPETFMNLFPKKSTETELENEPSLEVDSKLKDRTEIIPPVEVYTHKEEIIADKTNATFDFEVGQEEEKVRHFPFSVEEEDDDDEALEIVLKKEPEELVEENLSDRLLKDFGEFDPKLELSQYRFPTLEMLKEYNETISVNPEELQKNKDKIVETLKNYNIGISHIKATVGPTVTLYEIIPQAGVRISKIKNLEDDIALSLSALGIRIIAPIPGKGTIGIEVPNANPTLVSMRSVIASQKFQSAEMDLPIALGKTISNETFVFDLTKMPHLLMAGATGQGKSVGLNAVMASLIYKKHPAEVKFVLIDPKKVELTLYNKIERHYLAKLPDTDEAIITDTHKVINTLNSLCLEMDDRYDLLKNAMVRDIKEYNRKFKDRKLNPENGHRFLPYIVLIIDEFADLIMTAGKEVETPIARLAQLARAIGIHLIVATQRPSVNVITGIIKANFPARIAFRVTSKIDSRTILDTQGADQLIGKGDMLYSGRNELIRLQCAFIDTPEIEKITDFIGSQRGYPSAYVLPEYFSEDGIPNLDIDIDDRDQLFEEAAYIIVRSQQGSASLLQRKMKLGYNRAGRLIDQMEAAGIVGPFEGSKARQVLISDEISLKQFLDNERNKN
ncbi:MAG: DNA translocase FtsK 4TM domain-containing protein [Flavobacteriaceae bacterium]|nr:DNA translocase FtsK 4TM domain-containing protein [Flavobacteriaceae bacterium]